MRGNLSNPLVAKQQATTPEDCAIQLYDLKRAAASYPPDPDGKLSGSHVGVAS